MHKQSEQKSHINWAFFLRLYCIQLAVTLTIALVLAQIKGNSHAQSALMGGMASLIPQLYVGLRVFLNERKTQSLQQIVASFYVVELYKFILTAMVFYAAFKFVGNIEPLSLILTFIVVHILSLIASLLLKNYWSQT